jgi:hypothetical protein
MAKTSRALKVSGFGRTSRSDRWWLPPLLVFLSLSFFLVYATWAALQNAHYWHGNYLSPFYSPVVFGESHHSLFGPQPGWWPGWLPFSPALIILPFPALFRFTCYYYRGAYYKAFWADPPACAVSEPRKGYTGENGLPLILQNVHRYFLYVALAFLFFLWSDVYRGFLFENAAGEWRFGLGVGSLVLLLNTTLLTGYTLGCHSLRHLVGGRLDVLSKRRTRHACYSCVSGFNSKHMRWAWLSLFSVMFADLYVRMVSSGNWHDLRFF